jgi:hypothetical protein
MLTRRRNLLSRILVLQESSPSLTRRLFTTNNNNNSQSAVAAKDGTFVSSYLFLVLLFIQTMLVLYLCIYHTEEMYGGLKSLDILTSETHRTQSFSSSWKWHSWQLVAAMMPALGIYTLGQYVSHNHTNATTSNSEDIYDTSEVDLGLDELKDRLARVEEQLNAIATFQQQQQHCPTGASMNNEKKDQS